MKAKSLSFEFEDKEENIGVILIKGGKKVRVSIYGSCEIFVCNSEEERAYRIINTKHGGFKLRERTLL